MDRYLGMYVHMHWAYKHPYAARTWTLDDWRNYAAALSKLGYNLFMIWPMTETVPDPPTPSDIAQFEMFGRVTTMLQHEFGMTVLFTLGPNTVGNEKAASYTWQERPFFECDSRLNPADGKEMDRLMRIRRELLKHVAHADGFVVIDSDPGGYIGSTNEEFADLLQRHMEMLRTMNPKTMLYYWIWCGWESYNRFWQRAEETGEVVLTPDERDWEVVVRRMMEWPEDSWRVLSCNAGHHAMVKRLGIADKAIYLPYGLVEGEPNYPHTNCFPDEIERRLKSYHEVSEYLGCMANCQTHAVQQPNTYLFSHFAHGKPRDEVDLAGFAETLVPGLSKLISESWTCLNSDDLFGARELAAQLDSEAAKNPAPGPYSDLLFGTPKHYLEDLAMQLRFAADIKAFVDAVESGGNWKPALMALIGSFEAWTDRTGFVDAYYGQLENTLHPSLRKLGSSEIDSIIDDFNNWRNPAVRHGIVRRLLAAMKASAVG